MQKLIKKGKGSGYIDETNGRICMERCFACGKENYALAVSSGTCAWCGHDANKKPETTIRKGVKYGPSVIKGAIKTLILQDQLKMAQDKFRRRHGGLK
jgi:ribosomal protein L37E